MLPYQIEGCGHPLLLIHGWGVTHAVWHKLVPLLAPHFQLILVELPGAGKMRDVVFEKPYYPTCAEELEELRIALGIEKWAILAYSTGTRVCETYMQKYSTHVTRAVFLCPIYLRKSSYMLTRFFLKINAKHSHVVNWLLSDWRLYGWLLVYGFNLQRSDYINDWMNEIKLLPSENLKRVVTDLPGAVHIFECRGLAAQGRLELGQRQNDGCRMLPGERRFVLALVAHHLYYQSPHLCQHFSFGACTMPLLLLHLILGQMMRLL